MSGVSPDRMPVVLAVDIGGTKIAAGLADADDRLRAQAAAPTPAQEGPAAIVAAIARLARGLLAETGLERIEGIGVGTAGVVDTATGTIVSSTDSLAGWAGTPLAALLREEFGAQLPVSVQNDVDAHAAGEFRHGAAAGARSALIVAVGTGVGAGLLLEGAAVRGAHHVAGEIGHLPIPGAEHLRCTCGRNGHLEAIGSGIGMHRHFLSLGGSSAISDARGVVAEAAAGGHIAARALRESAEAVGRALAGAATLLDPERIVVTGGVAQIGPVWWEPMRAAYLAETIDVLQATPLLPGELGGEAPLRGAAAAAWDAASDAGEKH